MTTERDLIQRLADELDTWLMAYRSPRPPRPARAGGVATGLHRLRAHR
jgi:hypothetical protein